jgi:hypothetical protein
MFRGSTMHDRVSPERRPNFGRTPGVVDVTPGAEWCDSDIHDLDVHTRRLYSAED